MSSSSRQAETMKFSGTDSYVATDDLMLAVNAAIILSRPLLISRLAGFADLP